MFSSIVSFVDFTYRYLCLALALLAVVVVVVDTVLSGTYDSLAMLIGLILGATIGWLLAVKAAPYIPGWVFWTLIGVLGMVWIASVIVGAFVLYPGWLFGLLFSLPLMLAASLVVWALLLKLLEDVSSES